MINLKVIIRGALVRPNMIQRPPQLVKLLHEIKDHNPDPYNFKVLKHILVDNMLIVEIQYPDCINYEGKKILVFENVKYSDLMKQGSIDPHFSDNKKFKSPIARFSPTEQGWKWQNFFVPTRRT